MLKGGRVLITGGSGFIGSHLVDRFLSEGYKVTVVDDLSSGCVENVKSWLDNLTFRFLKGDLKNLGGWIDKFREVDVAFHYAAKKAGERMKLEFLLYREGVEETYRTLNLYSKRLSI